MSDATITEILKEQSATLEDAIALLEIAVDDHDCHFGAVVDPTTHWSFQAKLFLAKHANAREQEPKWLASIKSLEKAGDALADAMEHGRLSSDLVTAWDAVRSGLEQAANK